MVVVQRIHEVLATKSSLVWTLSEPPTFIEKKKCQVIFHLIEHVLWYPGGVHSKKVKIAKTSISVHIAPMG